MAVFDELDRKKENERKERTLLKKFIPATSRRVAEIPIARNPTANVRKRRLSKADLTAGREMEKKR